MANTTQAFRRLALLPLVIYRYAISPGLPASCRYYPSCSEYAIEAVETHGVIRGAWLAVRRLARCHPWHPGGVDPVPPETHSTDLGSR